MSASQYGLPSQQTSRQNDVEYGLHHVARHNAEQAEQQGYDEGIAVVAGLPSYQEPEPIGLGMNFNTYDTYPDPQMHDVYSQSSDPYGYSDMGLRTPSAMHTPPTPLSSITADVARSTRSGRAIRATDSPMSSDARVTKTKAKPKSKKPTKTLPPQYQLDVPFTCIKHDWGGIPLKEVDKRANWSKQERERGATKKDGRISRPMNAFLLYRSAWADRCKAYFNLSNHQYVSQILGASWAMEDQKVKDHWKKLSTLESDNHKHHLPDYRYQPSKPTGKRDQDDSDMEDFGVGEDPDGEYMPSGQQAKQQRKQPPRPVQYDPSGQYGQESYGYPAQMSHGQWEYSQCPQTQPQPNRYIQAHPYPGQGGQYLNSGGHNQWQSSLEEARLMNATPASNYTSGHGLVGLPGGHAHDALHQSRTHTPLQQYQQHQSGGSFTDQNGAVYTDHSMQQLVDPAYGLNLGQESHFSEAIGDFEAPAAPETMLQDNWLDPTLNSNIQTDYSFALD